jgi:integrase/recombinase XerD
MLSNDVARYVALHRRLGLKFDEQNRTLNLYARYADAHGDRYTLVSRIHDWCATASSPVRARSCFETIRRFCTFLNAEDPRYEVSPAGAFGRGKRPRPAPHLLEPGQIRTIMDAALDLAPKGSISPYTYHYLFGLMAGTGLRVSEALALQRDDLTEDGLIVRNGKFGKSRLLPIHATTRQALTDYMALRTRMGCDGGDLFVIKTGRAPSKVQGACRFRSARSPAWSAWAKRDTRAAPPRLAPQLCGTFA